MASRDFQRIPGRLEVEFRSPSALLVAYSINISRGGMFLQCDEELPPTGALLDLQITLPDRGIVSLTGVVAWQREQSSDSEPRGVGVHFDSLNEDLGVVVDSLVLEYSGLSILVMSGDSGDRKALLRRLKSIIGTAEVLFANDEAGAINKLTREIDLLIIDADEDESGVFAILRHATAEFGTPCIALCQHEASAAGLYAEGAVEVLGNPPNQDALRKSVLQALSMPSRVSPASK